MIIKVAGLFLVIIVVLAVMGRAARAKKLAAHCPKCRRPKIGTGPCPCAGPSKR